MPESKLRLICHNKDFNNERLKKAVKFARQGRHFDALPLLEKLVDEGESIANCYLGMIYEYGNSGKDAKFEHARFYYQRAAEDGWVPGYIGLGRIHYYGLGIEQDLERAFDYFSKIDKAGVVSPIADYYIGQMYFLGEFVSKDNERAKFFFRRSADNGYLWAKARLAEIAKEAHEYIAWFRLRTSLFITAIACVIRSTKDSWRTGLPTSTMGPSTITRNAAKRTSN
jgi:TPR repeat protein